MTEMPKTIRIGYRDFTVEAWSSAVAMASSRLGECDKQNAIIKISDNLANQLTQVWRDNPKLVAFLNASLGN